MTTIPPILALASALTFVILYHLRARWRGTRTGINIMTMGASLVLLAAGSLVRRLVHDTVGNWIILGSWLVIAVVMVLRTVEMWQETAADKAPPVPTPPRGDWYKPTPYSATSLLESPPTRKEQ